MSNLSAEQNKEIITELSTLIDGGEEVVEAYLKDKTLGERMSLKNILEVTYSNLVELKNAVMQKSREITDNSAEDKANRTVQGLYVQMIKVEILIKYLEETIKELSKPLKRGKEDI